MLSSCNTVQIHYMYIHYMYIHCTGVEHAVLSSTGPRPRPLLPVDKGAGQTPVDEGPGSRVQGQTPVDVDALMPNDEIMRTSKLPSPKLSPPGVPWFGVSKCTLRRLRPGHCSALNLDSSAGE